MKKNIVLFSSLLITLPLLNSCGNAPFSMNLDVETLDPIFHNNDFIKVNGNHYEDIKNWVNSKTNNSGKSIILDYYFEEYDQCEFANSIIKEAVLKTNGKFYSNSKKAHGKSITKEISLDEKSSNESTNEFDISVSDTKSNISIFKSKLTDVDYVEFKGKTTTTIDANDYDENCNFLNIPSILFDAKMNSINIIDSVVPNYNSFEYKHGDKDKYYFRFENETNFDYLTIDNGFVSYLAKEYKDSKSYCVAAYQKSSKDFDLMQSQHYKEYQIIDLIDAIKDKGLGE